MKNKYKALDLYKLSKKQNILDYEGFTNEKKWYFVKWILLNDENKRKYFLNWISKYIKDVNVTKKILDENVKYAVWLFSSNDLKNLTLSFWTTKEVLEKFNKKISLNLYKKYFDENESISDFNWNNLNLDFNKDKELIKSPISNFDNKKVKTFIWAKKIMDQISSSEIKEKDVIKNRDIINTAMNTLKKEISIKPESLNMELFNSIMKIDYPFSKTLKELALKMYKPA